MAAYCVYRGIEVEVAVATITAMLEHTGSDLRGKERFIVGTREAFTWRCTTTH
jgi:hypothetical protein